MPTESRFFLPTGMIEMSEHQPKNWEVWHARFNFQEGHGYKFRPVIIIDTTSEGSLVMMITSIGNKLSLEHDYILIDWEEAGLDKPSIARADRIAIIPPNSIGTSRKIGMLSYRDIAAIKTILFEMAAG